MTDMERQTRLARMLVAPPAMVFEELKAYGADVRFSPYSHANEEMEAALAERDDPLINLGLAGYGCSREVIGQLYKRAKDRSIGTDDRYRKGVRLAVLGNETIGTKGFRGFPEATIGDDEIAHVMINADSDEAALLVTNPTVADDILLTLYRGDKWALEMEENRRRDMISMSAQNPRLTAREDNEYGPDMGHWSLHTAIFELVGAAPTSKGWVWTLHHLLSRLDPDQVRNSDEISTVLERWKVSELGEADAPEKQHYTDTGLSPREELRCLIGSLYGKSYGRKEIVIHGSAEDEDVAKRCVFYGNARLAANEMEEGFERDGNVFVYAAMSNDDVFMDRKLRKKFEDDCLNGSFLQSYRRRCEQLQKRWKWFDPRPTAEWMIEERPAFDDPLAGKVARIATDLKQLTDLAKWLPWVIVAMAGAMIFRG